MSKLHSMPMFWAEFFADTEHMEPDAAKAYLFLLGHAWLRGALLENDDRVLARLSRTSFKRWLGIKADVLPMFTMTETGMLTQKRLAKEWEFVSSKVEKNRANGSLGGKRKSEKSHSAGNEMIVEKSNEINERHVANATKTLQQPTPTPTPTLTVREDLCPKPAPPPSGVLEFGEPLEATETKPKKRTQYPEDFERFWSQYPAEGRVDKKDTADFWKKMGPEERQKAVAAIPAFKKWVAKQGSEYRVLYAIRYLRKERYNDVAVTADGTAEIKIDWSKRLTFARKVKEWDVRNWGPIPHHPGCNAPSEVLLPDDGKGWKEFQPR